MWASKKFIYNTTLFEWHTPKKKKVSPSTPQTIDTQKQNCKKKKNVTKLSEKPPLRRDFSFGEPEIPSLQNPRYTFLVFQRSLSYIDNIFFFSVVTCGDFWSFKNLAGLFLVRVHIYEIR